MKTSEYLRAAVKLFKRPRSWTRYALAKDAEGYAVTATSQLATCFCLTGAVIHVTGEKDSARDVCMSYVGRALSRRGWIGGIASWNDNTARSKQDVISLLEEAVVLADV